MIIIPARGSSRKGCRCRRPSPPAGGYDPEKTYVLFYVGDYDSAAWTARFIPRWAADPLLGKNPLMWLESEFRLKQYVIGNTPKKMSSNRHEEIMMWLRDDDRPAVKNFAILDDIEYGMNMFGGHFFKCEYDKGLTMEIADAVVGFFALEPGDMKKFGKNWRESK